MVVTMCIYMYVSTAANVVQCAIGIKNGCKYILSSCFVNFSVGGLPSYLIWLDASDIAAALPGALEASHVRKMPRETALGLARAA